MISWIEQGPTSQSVGFNSFSTQNLGTGETRSEKTVNSTIGAGGVASTINNSQFGFTENHSLSVHAENFKTEDNELTSQSSSASETFSITSVSPASDPLHGTTSYTTGSSTLSGSSVSFEGSTVTIDSSGTTTSYHTSIAWTEFGTFTGASGITVTGHSTLTAPVTSFSNSSTTSGTILSSSFSTVSNSSDVDTLDTTNPPKWQTTQSASGERDFTSWTVSSTSLSEWTTTTTTNGTITETLLTSQSYSTSSWHVSTRTSTTDTGAGEETTTITVTSSHSSSSVETIDGPPKEVGFFDKSVYVPSPCCVLYTAGPLNGIADFCGIFNSVPDSTSLIPNLSFTTSATGSSDLTQTSSTFSSTSPEVTINSTTSVSSFTSSGVSDSSYETSVSGMPGALETIAFSILDPDLNSGYQPWTSMQITDFVYDSFTIHVDSGVTDTAEIARRSAGRTFQRRSVTQIMPLYSQDSLSMGTTVSPQTATYQASGGYGGASFDNTLVVDPGFYSISKYSINTDGDRVSETTTSTFSTTSEVTFPRGDIWAVSVYSATATGTPDPITIFSVYSGLSLWTNQALVVVTEVNCNMNTDRP